MVRKRLPVFDEISEPIDRRIATGLHKIGLALKQHAWAQANEDGLSPTQGQILAVLSLERAKTGTELSERIGVSLPTISDSVRVLVEKKLIERRPDPRHPRASLLELTPAGRLSATRARAWPEFLSTAVSVMSQAEQEAFFSGLVKVIATLQEAGQVPTSQMCISCTYFRPNVHDAPMPHHCALVDAPMANRHLRLECAEHEPAGADAASRAMTQFLGTT